MKWSGNFYFLTKENEGIKNRVIEILNEDDAYGTNHTDVSFEELKVDYDTVENMVNDVCDMMLKEFPKTKFSISASSWNMNTDSENYYTRISDGITVSCKDEYWPEGFDGFCPECGGAVLIEREYSPGKIYTCPECGYEFELDLDGVEVNKWIIDTTLEKK